MRQDRSVPHRRRANAVEKRTNQQRREVACRMQQVVLGVAQWLGDMIRIRGKSVRIIVVIVTGQHAGLVPLMVELVRERFRVEAGCPNACHEYGEHQQ